MDHNRELEAMIIELYWRFHLKSVNGVYYSIEPWVVIAHELGFSIRRL